MVMTSRNKYFPFIHHILTKHLNFNFSFSRYYQIMQKENGYCDSCCRCIIHSLTELLDSEINDSPSIPNELLMDA